MFVRKSARFLQVCTHFVLEDVIGHCCSLDDSRSCNICGEDRYIPQRKATSVKKALKEKPHKYLLHFSVIQMYAKLFARDPLFVKAHSYAEENAHEYVTDVKVFPFFYFLFSSGNEK